MNKMRNFTELSQLQTFEERFRYLMLSGEVGKETFGWDRYLNQALYRLPEWKAARNKVIVRDNGCDLGIGDREIFGRVLVHHMNPITIEDIENGNPDLYNPEYLITVSHLTHNAIHYGDESILMSDILVERTPNDTCPWKIGGNNNG